MPTGAPAQKRKRNSLHISPVKMFWPFAARYLTSGLEPYMALPARLLPADRDRAAAERDSLPLISGSPLIIVDTAKNTDGCIQRQKGQVGRANGLLTRQ
ncbi:hypothetical protein EYF80_027429 [Liparis tanakae]|uniref:Uncharacterized protein n=1 Tax=Liparis tanakae TaxID=230148 RepID=A0A4Z2H965_9TELE|nr:hypothetical protein EYF80_027429 [Liparis tanakae]